MSKRILFLSMHRIKLHELRSTVRIVLGKEMNWVQQSEIYSKIENEAIQSFLKVLGPLILGYLIANSLRVDNKIGLTISSIDIFAPAPYFLFFLSFALLMCAVAFNHLSTAMTAKALLAGMIRIPGFSMSSYDVLHSRSQNGLGIPNYLNLFHKGVIPVQGLLQLLFLVVLISVLLPLLALGSFLFSEQISITVNAEVAIIERLTAAMGLVATVSAAIFVVFFHLPMPVKKNKGYIRWNFLYWLPPHSSDADKFERWRNDEE